MRSAEAGPRPRSPLLLLILCVLCGETRPSEAEPCRHRDLGDSRPVSLERVRRAQAEVKEKLALLADRAARLSPSAPFESGLPACRARALRTRRTEVPPELVGRTIGFGPSGRIPAADVRVATSAPSLFELDADALADPALSERLGVRCFPTVVRARSEVELELVENP
jgi:hypothetical protein